MPYATARPSPTKIRARTSAGSAGGLPALVESQPHCLHSLSVGARGSPQNAQFFFALMFIVLVVFRACYLDDWKRTSELDRYELPVMERQDHCELRTLLRTEMKMRTACLSPAEAGIFRQP
jgi:hypothetical protein